MEFRNSVSVIIPTFNRANFISESLESILNQTHPPAEVIVVDDGSTDNTAAVVATFGSHVRYVKKENEGKSTAINQVLPLASGEFVWIFDDDDYAYPRALEQHIGLHQRNRDLGFTFGWHELGISSPDGRIQRTQTPPPPKVFNEPLNIQRVNLLRYCAMMLSGCVIRRSALDAVGTFRTDLHRSQDYDMLIRLSQEFDFYYTGEPTFIIRKHEGMRGPVTAQHTNDDRRRVWRRYDYLIGCSIADMLPLHRYLTASEELDNPEATWHRTALMRRAWVMASKANVEQLVRDLLAAAGEGAAPSHLNNIERECCQSLCNHPYFLMCLFEDPKCLHPLLSLGRNTVGRQILIAISKGLYWKAIESGNDVQFADRARILRAAATLLSGCAMGGWRRA